MNNIRRIGGNEREYINEVLETEFRGSKNSGMMGRFESNFTKKFDSKFAISFMNGTATMHAALEAMEIGPGDEVIVPPLTMSSTSFAVLQANATPVFADVDLETFQIDVDSIRRNITSNTKAIITVSLYGLCPDMDPIMELAKANNLYVIEDNAECFLGRYKNRLVGTLGDCASFSFQSTKHLTSGEGGVLITNNESLADKVRKVQSLGYAGVSSRQGKISKIDVQDPNYSRHISMGWNYRMPELCCAVALAQMERIDELVEHRIKVAAIFEDVASNFQEILIPQKVGSEYLNSYWTWVCKLVQNDIGWHEFRDLFIANGGEGIYAAWKLTYLEPMFENLQLLGRDKFISEENKRKYKKGLCPNAEYLQPRLLQFKTSYWDISKAHEQANVLYKTLRNYV